MTKKKEEPIGTPDSDNGKPGGNPDPPASELAAPVMEEVILRRDARVGDADCKAGEVIAKVTLYHGATLGYLGRALYDDLACGK